MRGTLIFIVIIGLIGRGDVRLSFFREALAAVKREAEEVWRR
jgi:hypothetical protein